MKRSILALFLLALSCGYDEVEQAPAPSPAPQRPPANNGDGGGDDNAPIDDKTSFVRVQEIHDEFCTRCHASANFIYDETALKRSAAKLQVETRRMPPSGGMPDDIREEYLNFFSG